MDLILRNYPHNCGYWPDLNLEFYFICYALLRGFESLSYRCSLLVYQSPFYLAPTLPRFYTSLFLAPFLFESSYIANP